MALQMVASSLNRKWRGESLKVGQDPLTSALLVSQRLSLQDWICLSHQNLSLGPIVERCGVSRGASRTPKSLNLQARCPGSSQSSRFNEKLNEKHHHELRSRHIYECRRFQRIATSKQRAITYKTANLEALPYSTFLHSASSTLRWPIARNLEHPHHGRTTMPCSTSLQKQTPVRSVESRAREFRRNRSILVHSALVVFVYESIQALMLIVMAAVHVNLEDLLFFCVSKLLTTFIVGGTLLIYGLLGQGLLD